jgi:hypothetical protein
MLYSCFSKLKPTFNRYKKSVLHRGELTCSTQTINTVNHDQVKSIIVTPIESVNSDLKARQVMSENMAYFNIVSSYHLPVLMHDERQF